VFISQVHGQHWINRRKIDKYACAEFQHRPVCHHIIVSPKPIGNELIQEELDKHSHRCGGVAGICGANVPFDGQTFLDPSLRTIYMAENAKAARVQTHVVEKWLVCPVPGKRVFACNLCKGYETVSNLFVFQRRFLGRGEIGASSRRLTRALTDAYMNGRVEAADTVMHFAYVLEMAVIDLWMQSMDAIERLNPTLVRRHLVEHISRIHLNGSTPDLVVCCSSCYYRNTHMRPDSESIHSMLMKKGEMVAIRLVDLLELLIDHGVEGCHERCSLSRYLSFKARYFPGIQQITE
jgi:hypothetical protein